MAAFASAIRANSDSYNFWGMVNRERDVRQRYYTWKALVSLTLLVFFSRRGYLFPMVQNRLDITVHQFQGFPWRYLHQISPVKLQVEIGRPETHRVETRKETAKVQAAHWQQPRKRQRGGEAERKRRLFSLDVGEPQAPWANRCSTCSWRGRKGLDSEYLQPVLLLQPLSPA